HRARHHLPPGPARDLEPRPPAPRRLHLYLDLFLVELARAQSLAEALLGSGAGIGADQGIDDPFLGSELRPRQHVLASLLAGLRDRGLDQVAHDLLDVAADITDLGELGGLDLDERRAGELGKAAGDLGLADAG